MIRTVWNAWEEEPLELNWPEDWPLSEYSLADGEPWGEEAVEAALRGALSMASVAGRLAGARSACVLVDDHTRPVAWGPILRRLIELMGELGLAPDRVTVLVSLAGHARMAEAEVGWKVGRLPDAVRFAQHSLEGPFKWLEAGGKRVGVNSLYAEAGFKVALGSLIPHPFAGLSGGAKAVMPGVADLETIRRNHRLVAFGRGKVADPANGIRRQMEEITEAVGLDLLVNAAVNGRREVVALFAGPPRQTYAEASAWARRWSACPPARPHDVVILNAYPKDREMLQVSNAFNVLATLPKDHLEQVRDVVLIARAKRGLGFHALFGPGGPLYSKASVPWWMAHAKLLVYSPGLAPEDLQQSLGGELLGRWDEVLERLAAGGARRDAGIWHQASLQTAE
ncbi:MAG: DUF2088 domain-containing protein [Bryobacteraceae bacterium]|nr:DUF2088 domain-containing protein [Bryobacteraceae bacterium]